ncbi:MAG: DNA repair protein RadA [Candidatus Saccharimonadales bacterium]
MAKKGSVRFVCSSCGASHQAWAGRCSTCGEWNTLQEEIVSSIGSGSSSFARGQVLHSQSVDISVAKDHRRFISGIDDIDSVLGGGVVNGSVTLLTGQPGIGKSTLLLQLAYVLSRSVPVLYISGEESAHQIGLRANRLGEHHKALQLATSNSTDDIVATIAKDQYKLVIVDSIQSVAIDSVPTSPGTVSQITNSAQLIMQAAKQFDVAVILVGHVTKEGVIAGPKILEHVVDVVLQLEGDRYGGFKLLRATKNRFGSTNETGIFEMTENGLKPVKNPSESLLAERQISDGSIVLAAVEGTRSLLVEVQALVNRTSYGYPKRTSSGFDLNRLNLLVAMLERRTKLDLADKDIYVNIVGGIRINEPAADLAICMAIGSAAKSMQLKDKTVVFGEVGLSGEVRHVPFMDKRLAEAKKLGFNSAIGPMQRTGKKLPNLDGVLSVRTALNTYLEKT